MHSNQKPLVSSSNNNLGSAPSLAAARIIQRNQFKAIKAYVPTSLKFKAHLIINWLLSYRVDLQTLDFSLETLAQESCSIRAMLYNLNDHLFLSYSIRCFQINKILFIKEIQ
jgi:hypothetical protein